MSEVMNIGIAYMRNPDIVLREEDEDGALLFNPGTNQVRVINLTGLFIWQHCDGQSKLEEILEAMLEAFEDVPANQVGQHVQEFLDGRLRSGFIGMVDKPQ